MAQETHSPKIVHPFVIFLFPVLFLYARNIDEVKLPVLALVLVLSAGVSLVLFQALRKIYRDPHRTAFLTTLVVLVFFSYGHVHALVFRFFYEHALKTNEPDTLNASNALDLAVGLGLGLCTLLGVVIAGLKVFKSRRNFHAVTRVLNVTALVLIVPLVVSIGARVSAYERHSSAQVPAAVEANKTAPDIYYIMLDGYARQDVLRTYFAFDNSSFIRYLRAKGFYVACRSRSNYAYTPLSLASTLNMKYINYFGTYNFMSSDFTAPTGVESLAAALRKRGINVPDKETLKAINDQVLIDRSLYLKYPEVFLNGDDKRTVAHMKDLDDPGVKRFNRGIIERGDAAVAPHNPDLKYFQGRNSTDMGSVFRMVEENAVVRFLKARGYVYVHFDSTWIATRSSRFADVLVNDQGEFLVDEFVMNLINTTGLRYVKSMLITNLVQNRLNTFEVLKQIPGTRRPMFVFAHIVLPHPPFLFNEDGSVHQHVNLFEQFDLKAWEDKGGYAGQTAFTNRKVEEVIDAIFRKSVHPPIIVIQSDHGPFVSGVEGEEMTQARVANFSAYYFPGARPRSLYGGVTPVNTFRIIFNNYFQGGYPVLRDESYYSPWRRPFAFRRVGPIPGDPGACP